jgi:phosphohistidine phosphatase
MWQTVPNAIIADGTFKYVLVATPERDAYFVRGNNEVPYHMDLCNKLATEVPPKWNLECAGGGRISHERDDIKVYGHSKSYGLADHSLTCKVLKIAYPHKTLSWSNEGY